MSDHLTDPVTSVKDNGDILWKTLFLSLVGKTLLLALLSIISDGEYYGFYTNSIASDDVRYVSGALFYSENASSFVDILAFREAFAQYGDYTGYSKTFSIWYWIVCLGVYLTDSIFLVRVLNIGISIATAYYVYKLCFVLFGKKSANYAVVIYSFFPYFFIFPLFLYKDQFAALLIVQAFYFAWLYRTNRKIGNVFKLCITITLFSFLRSGFTLILAASILFAIMFRNNQAKKNLHIINTFIIFNIFLILFYVNPNWISESYNVVLHKITVFIVSRQITETATIELFQLSNFYDVYRLPFTFVFALLQPINLTGAVRSPSDLVGSLFIFNIVFMAGNLLSVFHSGFRVPPIVWSIHFLFVLTLISSLGITRHYYFMLPFYTIFLSSYFATRKGLINTLLLSIPFAGVISAYYLLKVI